MTKKKDLIILTGPTAAGKTDLSVKLAQTIGGAIISADSMQVYKKLDIGSAKIKKEEMKGVPHYLIDILEPQDSFNVCVFKEQALAALDDIYKKGLIPIVTGGTGFYIQALLYDIDFDDDSNDPCLRNELEKKAEEDPDALYEELLRVDPESAAIIHKNNVKRVIRALEFYRLTGQKISEHNSAEHAKSSAYNSAYFVLNMPRPILYQRIDKRVDMMFEEGLYTEVKTLYDSGLSKECTSMQGLGYKELFDHFAGEISLDEAIYRIKRDTRHFAKRQLTWFRRERDVIFINKDEFGSEDEILDHMLGILKSKDIICCGKNEENSVK